MKFARISSRFSRQPLPPHPKDLPAAQRRRLRRAARVPGPGHGRRHRDPGRLERRRRPDDQDPAQERLRDHVPPPERVRGRGSGWASRVDAKQVIGYVGSSGESTGPHLDYRILYHGKYVNPLGWKFQPAEPLRKEFLEPFKTESGEAGPRPGGPADPRRAGLPGQSFLVVPPSALPPAC